MKKLLYLLLALPMLLAACEKTPEPTPEPGPDGPLPGTEPELYLVSNGVQYFEAAGGEDYIEYTLYNADGAPQATCQAEWVTNITVVAAESKVTFVVAPNEGEERETTLVLSYETLSIDVTLKQEAAEAPAVRFAR